MRTRGIEELIKRRSTTIPFTCNVGIPIYGKDSVAAPIPFTMDVYITSVGQGDVGWRERGGDVYNSKITIYSLKPIGVLSSTTVGEYLSFGTLDTNFTCVYKLRFYRITKQIKMMESYYVYEGELSV